MSKNLVSVSDKMSPDGKLIVSAISAEIECLPNELKDNLNIELDKLDVWTYWTKIIIMSLL